jgi:hypothetical protein
VKMKHMTKLYFIYSELSCRHGLNAALEHGGNLILDSIVENLWGPSNFVVLSTSLFNWI